MRACDEWTIESLQGDLAQPISFFFPWRTLFVIFIVFVFLVVQGALMIIGFFLDFSLFFDDWKSFHALYYKKFYFFDLLRQRADSIVCLNINSRGAFTRGGG